MVYLILPIFNRINHTTQFIDDLLKQSYQDFHLILVDDGSTDGSEEFVRSKLGKKVTVLKGRGNWWWGGSLHQAYLFLLNKTGSIADYVLIMNNDTSFGTEFIQIGIDIIKKNPLLLLTANSYSLTTNELLDSGVTIDWNKFEFRSAVSAQEINCLSTRGLIMHFSAYKKIGGFYPLLLPHYFSDYEYTHRAFIKGFKLITDNSFKLSVDESSTGIEILGNNNISGFKEMFAKRYKSNPIYLINFIVLSSPNYLRSFNLISTEIYNLYRSLLGILISKLKQKKND